MELFQASASWVVCGSSGTNMYAYRLWLRRVRIIVASNSWMDEIQHLPVSDAQWQLENSVYIAVHTPLWLCPSEPLALMGLHLSDPIRFDVTEVMGQWLLRVVVRMFCFKHLQPRAIQTDNTHPPLPHDPIRCDYCHAADVS